MVLHGLHRALLMLGIMLLGGMCCTAAAQSPYPVVRALQNTLDSLQAQDDFPGATAAVVLPDGTLHAVATGTADREDATRMPPDARMLSGSTGKSFAAAVALALAQEGRLDLDAPIARWLGDRPWFGRLPNADALTLRHLLRHQSGLRDHIHDDGFLTAVQERMQADGPDVAFAPEELVAFVLDAEPLFTVGAGFHYSDTNYILAGLIIEEATDSTYYDVLQERLLTPLRLTATAPADRRDLPGLVAGYVEGEAPFGLPSKVTENGTLVYNPATEWTGGGLITSASDLARWAHLLYTGEALPVDYLGELLAAVPKDTTQQARFGPEVQYGLGVTIRSTELGTAYGHRGWTPGYLSIFEYYPAHEVAVAVQVNALGPYELSRYAVHLARAVRAADE